MKRKLKVLSIFALMTMAFAFILVSCQKDEVEVKSSEVTMIKAGDLGDPSYTEEWDGRGTDSQDCEKVGENDRPPEGWIHFVFNTKGESTDARLILGGTGEGTYEPGEPLNASVWHFYTPYFDVEGLEATIYLYGGDPGKGGGLVISDFCPGIDMEMLVVTKTIVPSFTRTHDWAIDKSVDTENGYELDDFPKIWLYIDGSGNETATWVVDVTYEGYEDSDHFVEGVITVENTGTTDAVITSILDILFYVPEDQSSENEANVPVECENGFPVTLEPGQTLTCTYYYPLPDKATGTNTVKVTTEKDKYEYSVDIEWGDPTTEINETVNVKDISDLFGEKNLGTVTAPNDKEFTYDKEFAWANYGTHNCGSYEYNNTATIVETEQSASAKLKVNVQCYIYETAFAKGDDAICFIPAFSNWGWTNPITPGTYEMELWAAAGQCNTDKGVLVGTVTVVYDDDGNVTVTYNVVSPYTLEETHVYAGYDMFPTNRQGRETVAPGQYTNNSPFDGSQIYVIAHAVVGIPDPDFGPGE
jgi:hypothetical protein